MIIIYIVCKVSPAIYHDAYTLKEDLRTGEIHTIIECEQGYEERIKSLENDLSVFKRACFTSENEKRLLTEEVNALRGKLDALENKKTVGFLFTFIVNAILRSLY